MSEATRFRDTCQVSESHAFKCKNLLGRIIRIFQAPIFDVLARSWIFFLLLNIWLNNFIIYWCLCCSWMAHFEGQFVKVSYVLPMLCGNYNFRSSVVETFLPNLSWKIRRKYCVSCILFNGSSVRKFSKSHLGLGDIFSQSLRYFSTCLLTIRCLRTN